MTETKDEANASQVRYVHFVHLQGVRFSILAMDLFLCFNGELLT